MNPRSNAASNWGASSSPFEDVEPFAVRRAGGRWLDVTGAQQFHDAEISRCAATIPVLDEPLPKYILAHSLHDEALRLGGARQRSSVALEAVKQRVG